MRNFLVHAFCFIACTAPRAAAQCGELPPIAVQSADGTCVTQAALHERIASYAAGGPACAARGAGLSLQLTAAARRAEWVLLRAGAPVASRQFEALPAGCSELRDMLAVSIALALEHALPEAAAETRAGDGRQQRASRAARAAPSRADPTVAAPAGGAAPAADPPAASALAPQPPAAATRSALRLYAGAEAQLFALSSPLWLGAAGVELTRGWLGVQLGGFGGAAAGLALGRGHADVSVAGAELAGCGGAHTADLHAQLCLGILGAGVFAQGEGYAPNLSGTSGWGAAALAVAVSWPRSSKLALRLSGRGLLNAVRPELQVAGRSESLLLARLGAGARLEMIFALP